MRTASAVFFHFGNVSTFRKYGFFRSSMRHRRKEGNHETCRTAPARYMDVAGFLLPWFTHDRDKKLRAGARSLRRAPFCFAECFYYVGNIACDISGISTKAPCEAALMDERHMRIEISDFVMRTFVSIAIPNEDSICCLFSFWQRLYFPKVWFPSILYAASPQGRKPWNVQDCACTLYGRCRFFLTLI